MTDARALQRWEDSAELVEEPCRGSIQLDRMQCRASAQNHPRAVRRRAVVEMLGARLDHHPSVRNQLSHTLEPDGLGGDQEARDRHQSPRERRGRGARVPVRRRDDLRRIDGAARGVDSEAIAVPTNATNVRPSDDLRAGRARALEQSLLEQCRVHSTVRAKQQSALIAVRVHLVADVGTRQDIDRHREIADQRVRVLLHRNEVVGLPRAAQTARHLQIAINVLAADQRRREVERCDALPDELLRLRRAEFFDQLRVRQSMTVADHSARSARRTLTRRQSLEHDDRPTGACERQRGRQAGITGADHRDIAARRQRAFDTQLARRRVPPVRVPGKRNGIGGQAVLSLGFGTIRISAHRGPRTQDGPPD